MDLEDYQTCDLKLELCCDYIDEEIENIMLNSKTPCQISQEDIKKIKRQKKQTVLPKSKRELSLGFRSKQLKQRFVKVCHNMPGRVEQAQTIFQFIAHSENGASSPLVLSGHTGCGKTSLIKQVLQFFENSSNTVSVAYLNCMSARTVNLIYTIIHSCLYQGKKAARSTKPCEALNQNFRSGIGKDEKTKIIVLDEVDHVIKQQNFLYNMLQWLNIGAKIILILISNVVDLTVKLDAKIQSRWKFENIIFPCYNSSQITEIINHKYSNIRNFIPTQTISFLAKKICNLNSDIRTLNKIQQRIQSYYYENGRKMLTNDIVSNLIEQDTKVASMQHSYSTLLEVLEKAEKKTQVSTQIINKLYFIGKNYPKNEDILYMLCDLQDAGLIKLISRKSSDITFHNYGIKISENLHFYIESKGEK